MHMCFVYIILTNRIRALKVLWNGLRYKHMHFSFSCPQALGGLRVYRLSPGPWRTTSVSLVPRPLEDYECITCPQTLGGLRVYHLSPGPWRTTSVALVPRPLEDYECIACPQALGGLRVYRLSPGPWRTTSVSLVPRPLEDCEYNSTILH